MAVPGQLWPPSIWKMDPSFFSMNPQFLKKSKLSLLRLFEPKSSKMTLFDTFGHLCQFWTSRRALAHMSRSKYLKKSKNDPFWNFCSKTSHMTKQNIKIYQLWPPPQITPNHHFSRYHPKWSILIILTPPDQTYSKTMLNKRRSAYP